MDFKLDGLNWEILGVLQQNSRASLTGIGREIGLTPPAVAERVKRMEDYGIIDGYWTAVSHTKLGYQLKAIITLRAFMGKLKPFLEHVKGLEEVSIPLWQRIESLVKKINIANHTESWHVTIDFSRPLGKLKYVSREI